MNASVLSVLSDLSTQPVPPSEALSAVDLAAVREHLLDGLVLIAF
jgi:hypothetical protein